MRISDWSSDVCSSDLRRDIQMVFQDPQASLNPRHRIGRIVGEPLKALYPALGREERRARVLEMLEQVGDRKSVVSGQSVSVRVDLGGCRIIKKKNNVTNNDTPHKQT